MQPIRLATFCACLFAAGLVHAETGALGPLRAAIECSAPLKATPALRNALHAPQGNLTGDYTLPEPLTVFGSLKVTAVSIFEGGPDEGTSYTVKPAGARLADVAKAARLKKVNGTYVRDVKGGHLEAGEPSKGEVQLSCIRGGNGD